MNRPRIAIPEIDQNIDNYTSAVYAAGMDPIVISIQTEQLKYKNQPEYLDFSQFHISGYEGLLLPGGGDVNPVRYGQKNQGCCIYIMDEMDELQFSVLDAFVKAKKPVLGICRGYQIINVYFGGTLIQNLDTSYRHYHELDEPDKVHGCISDESSWIAGLYGRRFDHNSAHHQAVDRLGEGLVIDSRCLEDGVPEALHHESLPVYGVQWHPERMCLVNARSDTVNGLPVFQFFCTLCGGRTDSSEHDRKSGIMGDGLGL